jgi:hypothetical protein
MFKHPQAKQRGKSRGATRKGLEKKARGGVGGWVPGNRFPTLVSLELLYLRFIDNIPLPGAKVLPNGRIATWKQRKL